MLVRRLASHPSADAPLQSAYPVRHTYPQTLDVHVATALGGTAQLVAQLPQWVGSLVVFTSQPFDATPSQLAKPDAQANPHTLPVHVGVALATVGHVFPHAPQLAESLVTFTSQPSRGLPLQFANPDAHTSPHAPARHVAVEFGPKGHTVEQLPQWVGSEFRLASQPFDATPSQLAKPLQHENPHTLAVQVVVALALVGHAFRHDPQLDGSMVVSTSQPFDPMPSQLAKPGEHTSPHTVDTQVADEFGPKGHAVAHVPQ